MHEEGGRKDESGGCRGPIRTEEGELMWIGVWEAKFPERATQSPSLLSPEETLLPPLLLYSLLLSIGLCSSSPPSLIPLFAPTSPPSHPIHLPSPESPPFTPQSCFTSSHPSSQSQPFGLFSLTSLSWVVHTAAAARPRIRLARATLSY